MCGKKQPWPSAAKHQLQSCGRWQNLTSALRNSQQWPSALSPQSPLSPPLPVPIDSRWNVPILAGVNSVHHSHADALSRGTEAVGTVQTVQATTPLRSTVPLQCWCLHSSRIAFWSTMLINSTLWIHLTTTYSFVSIALHQLSTGYFVLINCNTHFSRK